MVCVAIRAFFVYLWWSLLRTIWWWRELQIRASLVFVGHIEVAAMVVKVVIIVIEATCKKVS